MTLRIYLTGNTGHKDVQMLQKYNQLQAKNSSRKLGQEEIMENDRTTGEERGRASHQRIRDQITKVEGALNEQIDELRAEIDQLKTEFRLFKNSQPI